jgi:hypothetical protein
MDSIEPEQTPFAAVSQQTSRITRVSSALIMGLLRMAYMLMEERD